MIARRVLSLLLFAPALGLAQSSVDRLRSTSDGARSKYNQFASPSLKGIARADTLRTYRMDDVQRLPEFPGGEGAMDAYVKENFRYTDSLETRFTGGLIYVDFVVERNGAVDKVRIDRGISDPLDKEAVRVISSMPRWTPAMYFGDVRVACRMVLPIHCDPK